ncbi:hypothetical protein Ndes2526B_g00386 [Nannochloris sp. 'desiccata']|nr:putative NADH dehydrogenase [ubiquinone] iron-sulfur protein 5-B [Chlorella desiccata (nom. nud.)]
MASGFGINGGPGRCFPLWNSFSECMSKAEDPKDCQDFRQDYLECLLHRKEYSRLNAYFREDMKQREGGSQPAGHGGGGGH